MGTNFYFKKKNSSKVINFIKENCFYNEDYLYTIEENLCSLHIGKRSSGWKPCFQKTLYYSNMKEMEKFYFENKEDLIILDEYGEEYSWIQLQSELMNFNKDKSDDIFNRLDILSGYYKDDDGYDWCENDFS